MCARARGVTWHVQGRSRRRLIASLRCPLPPPLSPLAYQPTKARLAARAAARHGCRSPAERPAGRIDEGHTGHCMEWSPGRSSGKANPAPQEWSKFDPTSRLGQSLVRNPANASLDSPWDGRKHERPREERKSKAVSGGSKKGRSFSYPIGGRGREEGRPWPAMRAQNTLYESLAACCAEMLFE